jgi:hypothetical protein
LHRTQAHRDMQDAMAKVLNKTSGAAVHASELTNEGGQTRPITGLRAAGYLSFETTSTAVTEIAP